MATLNPAFTMPDGSLLVEAGQMLPVPTCEGGGTSGGGWPLMLMGAACHPSGNGFDVTVSSLSLVAGVDYLSLATRTGGTEFPCGQDSANPAHWHCRVSNPVPTDLQFCYLRASGSAACATFDRV